MSKFLIADPVHINTKNFASLYDYWKDSISTVLLNHERTEWMGACGNYLPFQAQLAREYQQLEHLSDDELFELSVLEINLFKAARAEILSYLITHPAIVNTKLPDSLKGVLLLSLEADRETVLWNMAAAIQWIHFWAACLDSKKPQFVLVFSGSLIYARTLLELLKNRPPRCFVLESSFTGSDNYVEEKYEPIANNSNLKFVAYYKSLGRNESPNDRDRSRNKAINKIIAARNKNVNQPPETSTALFDNQRPILLICGQVLNDFSVLEHRGIGMNSLVFYKELIQKLLDRTDLNVVFKAHPWERKKANLHTPFTFDAITLAFADIVEDSAQVGRLLLVEDYNLKSLFKQVSYVAGINSQALLEAAYEGFQPIQFGDAFFGRKGFTSDYDLHGIDALIDDFNATQVPGKLAIAGYKSFETFITKAFQFSLVSAFPSGKVMLQSLFNPTHPIPISTGPTKKTPPTNTPTQKIAQLKNTKDSAKVDSVIKGFQNKKWNKFLKTPRKFFLDSKNKKIKWLHIFFPSLMFR